MFQAVYLKINGKYVQRVVIGPVSTFDQKIIVFEEPKKILSNNTKTTPLCMLISNLVK